MIGVLVVVEEVMFWGLGSDNLKCKTTKLGRKGEGGGGGGGGEGEGWIIIQGEVERERE